MVPGFASCGFSRWSLTAPAADAARARPVDGEAAGAGVGFGGMRLRAVSAAASVLAVGAGAVALELSTDASVPSAQTGIGAGVDRVTPAPSLRSGFRAAREGCSRRSEANFPGAFTNPRNLVVGPLALIGGTRPEHLTRVWRKTSSRCSSRPATA